MAAQAPDWDGLVAAAEAARTYTRVATRHEGGLTSATKPQKFTCDDSNLYAVKFVQNTHGDGRGIFTEQVVALAGHLIGAPVPFVDVVTVSTELVDAMRLDPSLGLGFDPQPGLHHGSRWVGTNISDRLGLDHFDVNRERFGSLDVLYCWIPCTGDHQWIYNNDPPNEVYSVDHTTFMPDSFAWSTASLQQQANSVARDAQLQTLAITSADRAVAVQRLAAVTPEQLAAAVVRPPDAWGVGAAERSEVASYLYTRIPAVVAACS